MKRSYANGRRGRKQQRKTIKAMKGRYYRYIKMKELCVRLKTERMTNDRRIEDTRVYGSYPWTLHYNLEANILLPWFPTELLSFLFTYLSAITHLSFFSLSFTGRADATCWGAVWTVISVGPCEPPSSVMFAGFSSFHHGYGSFETSIVNPSILSGCFKNP